MSVEAYIGATVKNGQIVTSLARQYGYRTSNDHAVIVSITKAAREKMISLSILCGQMAK